MALRDFGVPCDSAHSTELTDALNAGLVDPTGATSLGILQSALAAVAGNVQLLWQSGARTFLVPTLPDPAVTPYVRGMPGFVGDAASRLAFGYNAGLEQALTALGGLPGRRLLRFDTSTFFEQLLADPAAAGLANVQAPCLTFDSSWDRPSAPLPRGISSGTASTRRRPVTGRSQTLS